MRLTRAPAELAPIPSSESAAVVKFQEVAQGRHVPRIYLKERALTKGWAVVRRSRAALGSVSRGE